MEKAIHPEWLREWAKKNGHLIQQNNGCSNNGETINGSAAKRKTYEEEMAEKRMREAISKAEIPRRFSDTTFETLEKRGLPSDEEWQRNYRKLGSFRNNLAERINKGEGVIFYGEVGLLKTRLAISLLREYITLGGDGFFISLPSLADRLRRNWATDREDAARFDDQLRRVRFLILDDMGAESTEKDWVLNKIESVITDRYNDLRSTIITTNLTKSQLVSEYSLRMMDRLREVSVMLKYNGDSLRKNLN